MMSSNKNYTIVFRNEKKNGKVFQTAANNVLTEDCSIQDYYKHKFNNKKQDLHHIDQENQPEDQQLSNNVKRDNFVENGKKRQSKPIQNNRKVVTSHQIPSSNTQDNNSIKHRKSYNDFNKAQKSINDQQDDSQNRNKAVTPPLRSIQKTPKQPIKQPTFEQPQHQKTKKLVSKPTSKPSIPKYNQHLKKPANKNKGEKGKDKKYSDVYQGPDKILVEQLERQLTECPTITFDDIAELETAKSLLQEAVLLPRMMPEYFKGIRRAMRGILLFGPPGTGKTLLAKAIANNNIFFNVSASSLASKWKGESQKMVRVIYIIMKLLFEMAKYHSPSVIFFDQIDAIASKRSQNEHESARKVKTQLLVQMDGVGSGDSSSEVFVLAATNRPWDLDQALRRRLQKRICTQNINNIDIPLPGKDGRRQMLKINLKDVKVTEDINWDKIVQQTKGCSGADICNICRDAAYMPMRRKIQQLGGINKLSELKQEELIDEALSQKDILEAAKKIKPSVGQDDLKRYADWMKEFGST